MSRLTVCVRDGCIPKNTLPEWDTSRERRKAVPAGGRVGLGSFHYFILCIQSFVSSVFTARSASWISIFKLRLRLNGALGGK